MTDKQLVEYEDIVYELTAIPPDTSAVIEDEYEDVIEAALHEAGFQDEWDNHQIEATSEKGVPVGAPVVIVLMIATSVAAEAGRAIRDALSTHYDTKERERSKTTREQEVPPKDQ